MNIEKFATGDESQAKVLLAAFKEHVLSADAMASFLASEGNYLVGAFIDGLPAGFAIAYWLERPDGKADMLFLYEIEVAETFRRRGVARRLIEQMKRDASGKFFAVTQESNEPALRLYESCGGRRLHSDDVLFAFDSAAQDS